MQTKINTVEVCENIRRLRTLQNYKAEEVAKKLGISKSAYSELENNKTEITLTRLQKLSDIFNVSYDFILNAKATDYQHDLKSPVALSGSDLGDDHQKDEYFLQRLFEKLLTTIDKMSTK